MIVRMFCKARLLYVMMSVSLSMCFLFSVRGLGYDDGGEICRLLSQSAEAVKTGCRFSEMASVPLHLS